MTGRRTSSDEQWKALKERVKKRDRGVCRLVRIVSVKEMMILKRNAPPHMLTQLDPAHIEPVGVHPEYCYLDDNVVMLNHYSHSNLDNMRSPLDGKPISRETRDNWWKRIAGDAQYVRLLEVMESIKSEETDGSEDEGE